MQEVLVRIQLVRRNPSTKKDLLDSLKGKGSFTFRSLSSGIYTNMNEQLLFN